MFELKPLSKESIPAALEKAVRYRLLNEPAEAESICHDVLRIEPNHQQALVTLLLAMTDRFERSFAVGATQVKELLSQLHDAYERAYYGGIICERRAKAMLKQNSPGAGFEAHDLLRDAMTWYEKAEAIRPVGNDDALLRWNACARIIMGNRLTPRAEDDQEQPLE